VKGMIKRDHNFRHTVPVTMQKNGAAMID